MTEPTDPFRTGMLDRPDGDALYWELSGRPDGVPALYLHGGPGGGLGTGGYRRRFDPDTFLTVGLDQRGCGRSTPWAVDALDRLHANTTPTLIADIEALREHLAIDRWLVHGVSWGSTLALAYALAHPERVTGIVLMAVTAGARDEIDWITEGMGRVFPEAWARIAALARPGERPLEACARLLRDGDQTVADLWDDWETTHVRFDPQWRPGRRSDDPRMRRNFATLVTHYWANDCFIDPIVDRVLELAGIPGTLIHGRRDVSGPVITAVRLHERWPGSRLVIVEDEGHGGPEMSRLSYEAMVEMSRGVP